MAAHHPPNYLPASPPARLNAYCSATGTTLRELVCVEPSFVTLCVRIPVASFLEAKVGGRKDIQ